MAPQPPNLAALLALGVDRQKALYALAEHGGEVEAAADWCFTEGATWTPSDLLQTSHTPALNAQRSLSPPPSFSSSRSGSQARASAGHAPGWRPVPHRLLVAGTKVAITLKQDQGTGRTVEGEVAERLTKGDHPRGVKVRLKDGRVGRVVRTL